MNVDHVYWRRLAVEQILKQGLDVLGNFCISAIVWMRVVILARIRIEIVIFLILL